MASFKEKEFKRNNYIYKKGDPVQYVYLIKEGTVELKHSQNKRHGLSTKMKTN